MWAKLTQQFRESMNILKATAFATYKEWSAYRSHMAISLFVGPIFFLVQVFIWNAIYGGRATVTGLTLQQMLTYYGIAITINYVIFDFSDWELQMLIRTGQFITFMLRPVSHCYYAFCQKVGHRVLALWIEFAPVLVMLVVIFKINLIPVNPGWTVISFLLSFILIFFINYTVGIMGFWLTKTEGIRRAFMLLRDLCAGVYLPLTFFPPLLQKVLFFLPFQFVTYVPTRVFLGSYELAGITMSIPAIVGLQALAVVLMYIVYRILWYFGVKKFTGVGV
ncbi:MAG TPA: ABC-2 family transporter protein [Bacillota bacterium]|nr:ABC-2 family transporter protein [Bacillota bacterium]HOL10733.1 ABC-2 family transporter protein [Bacillota bacterium]HPO98391.1 ABC-2 family transporter protein [Bacillota bacterium]